MRRIDRGINGVPMIPQLQSACCSKTRGRRVHFAQASAHHSLLSMAAVEGEEEFDEWVLSQQNADEREHPPEPDRTEPALVQEHAVNMSQSQSQSQSSSTRESGKVLPSSVPPPLAILHRCSGSSLPA